jgi:hypothetical protein
MLQFGVTSVRVSVIDRGHLQPVAGGHQRRYPMGKRVSCNLGCFGWDAIAGEFHQPPLPLPTRSSFPIPTAAIELTDPKPRPFFWAIQFDYS